MNRGLFICFVYEIWFIHLFMHSKGTVQTHAGKLTHLRGDGGMLLGTELVCLTLD